MTLLDALMKIKEEVQKQNISFMSNAICSNLIILNVDVAERAKAPNIFVKWPKFSGCQVLPVPAPKTIKNKNSSKSFLVQLSNNIHNRPKALLMAKCAYNSLPYWEDEYGKLRMELLDFCIDYLKENNFK